MNRNPIFVTTGRAAGHSYPAHELLEGYAVTLYDLDVSRERQLRAATSSTEQANRARNAGRLQILEEKERDLREKAEALILKCQTPDERDTHNMNLYFMLSEAHPLAGEASLDLRQLKNDSFIAMGDEGKGRTSFLERCRKAGFFPNINVTVADTELMMELCRKNLGIGVYAGERPLELPGLRIVPDKLHVWEFSICICTAAGHGVTAQEAELIKCFRKW